MMRIALVSNTPPPYRIPIFNRLADWPDIDFHAIFCTRREPNRLWDLPAPHFNQHFLRDSYITYRDRYIHHNPEVTSLLSRLAPKVIITDGFNPTHLYAYVHARLTNTAHVAMTDGTWDSEQSLSMIHRCLRRMVYRGSRAFIAASEGGRRLYKTYGVRDDCCFYSWLCIDNDAFSPPPDLERPFDFIFCSRMEPGKNPLFAIAVAQETARRLRRRTRLLLVGSGSLDESLHRAARDVTSQVDVRIAGFASQQALPALYQSARIFLFPSTADVWGIVANEACASGLPTIVSPRAGVAGELVVNDHNGYVRELDINAWVDCAQTLLTDSDRWHHFSQCSRNKVRRYHFDSAAAGIVDACRFAVNAMTNSTNH